MESDLYYLFDRSWAAHPARAADRASYNRQGVWWNEGQRFIKVIKTPIEIKLKPLLSDVPDQGPLMPALFKGPIPIYRDDLVEALRTGGADMEVFSAQVLDVGVGQVFENYRAVNILGLASLTDIAKSTVAEGLLFFRLVESQSSVIAHKSLRDHLVGAGFSELEFHRLEQAALPGQVLREEF